MFKLIKFVNAPIAAGMGPDRLAMPLMVKSVKLLKPVKNVSAIEPAIFV
jgi:hypothetical protein